ncbi:beta-lactamase family protein [Sphingomonas sp. RG327]|uniref:Beta-lactamase family protein n=1 Tax=Sphingomonas anseongensis TaxID=2908207 RepID=A0ABT0RHE3_9SPHN|nr:serine hydrolase domain-containing protein [Sphingomonas anseongensis]MCL6679692.1 beta-lactamase family protein [Sphingomonas anseongensis]
MAWMKWALAAIAALAIPVAAQSPTQLQPARSNTAVLPVQTPTTTAAPSAAPELNRADLDAWLDGYMPYALKAAGIPGAVVVVVKDGQPLTMRGFGYSDVKARKAVDPENTLFRPGSVSKLLTWTAVMQQVQAGKLDLDKDINTYLDFKIPAKDGKPVTLRNLMTHTGGFAETVKWLILYGKKQPVSLRTALTRQVPDRIYGPGEIPAYSNYGASLAGYIVERVSGEPFDQYIERHILAPAGMNHSSFRQPLPANLDGLMSKAYKPGTDEPQPFEVIALSPAGALSASGADMGRFMIAHLNNKLLDPATAKLMYAEANKPFSGLPAMALGFYHEDRNGLTIVGHGGDTVFFHSDLHLIPEKNVGLYISMNSVGKNGSAHALREQLLHEFTDRYYPAPQRMLATAPTAKEHGAAMSGHYVSSRAGGFNWFRAIALIGQTTVAVDKDNYLVASSITDPSGTPRKWREVGPWLWQEVNGSDFLQAIPNGKGGVKMFSITPYAPIIEFVPAPASLNAGWILPVAGIALLVLLIAAIGWPVVRAVRWRYGYKSDLAGRPLLLHRLTRATAWVFVAVLVGWFAIMMMLQSDLSALDEGLDIWMRLLQLLLVVAIVGTAVSVWNAWTVATAPGRHRFATVWAILIALAAVFVAWLCLDLGLLTTSLNY